MIQRLKKYFHQSKKYILTGLITTFILTAVNFYSVRDYYTAELFLTEAGLFFIATSYGAYMSYFILEQPYKEEAEQASTEKEEEE